MNPIIVYLLVALRRQTTNAILSGMNIMVKCIHHQSGQEFLALIIKTRLSVDGKTNVSRKCTIRYDGVTNKYIVEQNRVYEGNPLVIMGDPMTNADLTQEYFYASKWGTGLIMPNNTGLGIYDMRTS